MEQTGRDETVDGLQAPSRSFMHSTSDGEMLAQTAPSTSTLKIEAEPIRGADLQRDLPMLKLATFGFPEELMHGERQKFGLARNVRLLKAVSRARFYEYLRGDVSAKEIANDIYLCQLACDETNERRRDFLETVDQFRIQSVVDRDYLEEHAHSYASTYGHHSDDVLRELETEQRLLKKNIENQLLYDEVYRPLEEIAASYAPSVAEAVAHAALDIQAVVHPLDQYIQDDVPTISTDEITTELFLERFEQARREVGRLNASRPLSEIDRVALRRRLLQKLPPKGQGSIHPDPLRSVPLLDQPTELVEDDETIQQGKQSMDEADTFVDRILNGAFRVVGNLGGVVYPVGQDSSNVLVNPWVADTTIGEISYQKLWQREFFGDHIVTSIWDALKHEAAPEAVSVNCPFCVISPSLRCGDGLVCASEDLLLDINNRIPDLMRELWQIRVQYDGPRETTDSPVTGN